MKGDVITYVLLATVSVAMASVVIGWTMLNASGFFEINEIKAVRSEFENCNDRILETARTALTNKCIFSAERGTIRADTQEIEYQIISGTKLCDSSDWVLIDPQRNLWQRCEISGGESLYALKLNYSSISFVFGMVGRVEITGLTGKTIDISRESVNDDEIDIMLLMS